MVLTETVVQSEAHLPFAGLHQRAVLDAAFGLGREPAPERFRIAMAVLELLGEAATDAPLLVLAEELLRPLRFRAADLPPAQAAGRLSVVLWPGRTSRTGASTSGSPGHRGAPARHQRVRCRPGDRFSTSSLKTRPKSGGRSFDSSGLSAVAGGQGRPWRRRDRAHVRATIRASVSEARTTTVVSTAGTQRTWSPLTT